MLNLKVRSDLLKLYLLGGLGKGSALANASFTEAQKAGVPLQLTIRIPPEI